MKLFHEFHSRAFQYALDVLAALQQSKTLTRTELDAMAEGYGFDYTEQILQPLCDMGVLYRSGQTYALAEGVSGPTLAPNVLEQEYLQYILRLPEAELFLREETIHKLQTEDGAEAFSDIQHYAPQGEPLPAHYENVRLILQAIRERRLIRYQYITRISDTPMESVTHPWKLEHSAYDRRWWVILYAPAAKRTIKARLDNLADIRLDGPSPVTEKEIEAAMERLLEPEPVLLRVDNRRGALERCFLVFENQLFEETRQISDALYELKFRYYRFDRGEILRQLLYLGPQVTLMGPDSLRRELREKTQQALDAQLSTVFGKNESDIQL